MNKTVCGLLLIVFSCTAWADTEGHPVTLWRAQGVNNSVYLLGSIHLLRAEDHPLPSVIDTAYEDAEVLVMELDMDDLDSAATQQLFNQNGVLRDDTTLRDLMGEKLYAQAARAAEAGDIPIDMLAKSEPWLAAITVEMMALYRLGFNPMLGVEMHMMSRAVADGKPIEGLEAIEEQLAFLDGLSLEAQRAMLIQTLEESAHMGETIDEMIRAWRYGDVKSLESGLLDSLAEHEELNDALVTSRNERWVSQIGDLLDDRDDYLIIVGALHLVGEQGVPNLLTKKGVKILQLSESASIR
ncbi:MAG: TraB/GumN family protein [Gammaproteobacteria bacterium]|nr:TraB/GumN family protein [Gammaproteobacteria bacterium]